MLTGSELPRVTTALPGPRSEALVDTLARHECPAITARRARRAVALGAASDDPVVWDEARGSVVRDADGNLLVDMTSGFGVALVGHRHPAVVEAARAQMDRLLHAMGDVFPDRTRIALLERLAAACPAGLDAMILGLSGSDAVEAAVKTAIVATGRHGVLVFDGGYHGLTVGSVPLQTYKPSMAAPFRPILNPRVVSLPWGCPPADVARAVAAHDVGLVLLEPVQGRGGMRCGPTGWLAGVADATRSGGALLGLDEIQSGLGRTGRVWAANHDGVVPDLLMVGKALAGGFPLSACVGTRPVMDAWGASTGEALHTQTFLGHPVGAAAALAVLELLDREDVAGQAARVSARLRGQIEALGLQTRGRGLMIGVHLDHSLAVSRALLRRGFLALPAGVGGEVLGLTPAITLTDGQIEAFTAALAASLEEVA